MDTGIKKFISQLAGSTFFRITAHNILGKEALALMHSINAISFSVARDFSGNIGKGEPAKGNVSANAINAVTAQLRGIP